MFKKILAKFFLRTLLSLAVMVGIASIVLHQIGGDPMALLQRVGSGMGAQVAKLGASATASIAETQSSIMGADKSTQTLYRWTDANGVTHFSSDPPPLGQRAETVEVKPNQNVMDASRPKMDSYAAPKADTTDQIDMPGMAGIAQQGIDPGKLLRQFEQAQSQRQAQIP